MKIAEKKQLLKELLAKGKHGIQTRLARELKVTPKTIYLWANGKEWPKSEQELLMWDFLDHGIDANGAVKSKKTLVPFLIPVSSPSIGPDTNPTSPKSVHAFRARFMAFVQEFDKNLLEYAAELEKGQQEKRKAG